MAAGAPGLRPGRRPGRPDRLDVLRDPERLARRAALLASRCLRRAVRAEGRATLFLAGGTTPGALYRHLALEPWRHRVPWRRVEIWWGDERCVPPEEAESNFRLAREALLTGLPASPLAVHRIPGELGAAAAARHYGELLRARFGARGRPSLALLGLGADGHSAGLFPGQDWVGDGWVVTGAAPAEPRERVSLALPLLARARTVILMATGSEKAAAVGQLAAGEDLPASRLRPGRCVWLFDALAAATITTRCLPGALSPLPSPVSDSGDPSPATSGSSSPSS